MVSLSNDLQTLDFFCAKTWTRVLCISMTIWNFYSQPRVGYY